MSGVPRTPAALKLMNGRGNGKDSAGREVNVLPATRGKPDMPEIIELDETAREEWERVVPGLVALNILKPEDHAILTAYCITYSQYISAVMRVQNEGPTIYVTTRGASGETTRKPMVNPMVKIMAESRNSLLKFAREFGLTPASESLVAGGTPDGKGDDGNPFAGTG